MRKAELRKLVADFVAVHTDMAVERFDGDESNAAAMRGSVSSLPFLTERKLVVLNEPGNQKSFAENIEDILKEAADTTDLVIVEPKLDRRLSYYKTLKKITDFREFGDMDAGMLARWAAGYVEGQGGHLSQSDARVLIDRAGPNQQLLSSELDKLINYDPNVSQAGIELLVEKTPQSTVFELLDAAFAGHAKRAMDLYREQRALKAEPQKIIAMLAWQLHILALVKAAGGRGANDIASQAKVNPYVVRKTQDLGRHLSLVQVKDMISRLLELDVKLKTTAIDADEALKLYLINLGE